MFSIINLICHLENGVESSKTKTRSKLKLLMLMLSLLQMFIFSGVAATKIRLMKKPVDVHF